MNGRTAARLRDLASAMGEQIGQQDLPPLRLDASDGQVDILWLPSRRRWQHGRWLVPVVAAAAVLALVISLSVLAGVVGQAHGGRQRPADKLPQITPLTGKPQFLVSASDGRAVLSSVVRGRTIKDLVMPVEHFLIEGVAAAPGNRIFYLAGVLLKPPASEELEFYRVVVSSDGVLGPAKLVAGPPVELPLPVSSNGLSGVPMAISPDGRELAFSPSTALMPDPGTRQASITVRSLGTGASRTWSTWPSTSTQITQLSWASGGQLSYVATIGQGAVTGHSIVYHGDTEVNGIMILDTSAPGASLPKDSRVVFSATASGLSAGTPPAADGPVAGVITSDGQTVLAQVARHGVSRLAEISVATGQITKVLVSGKRADRADPAAVDGDNLLFTLLPEHAPRTGPYLCGHLALAKISTGRITALPLPASNCSTLAPLGPYSYAW